MRLRCHQKHSNFSAEYSWVAWVCKSIVYWCQFSSTKWQDKQKIDFVKGQTHNIINTNTNSSQTMRDQRCVTSKAIHINVQLRTYPILLFKIHRICVPLKSRIWFEIDWAGRWWFGRWWIQTHSMLIDCHLLIVWAVNRIQPLMTYIWLCVCLCYRFELKRTIRLIRQQLLWWLAAWRSFCFGRKDPQ